MTVLHRSSRDRLSLRQTLIGVDLVLILMAVFLAGLVWIGGLERMPSRFGLNYDHSLANVYNYLKWFVIAGLLFAIWSHSLQPVHAALTVVFLIVFFDDAFQLHERTNAVTARLTGFSAHVMGAVLLAVLALGAAWIVYLAWKRSDHRSQREAVRIGRLTLILVVVGGVLDTLQSAVAKLQPPGSHGFGNFAIGVLEDGLELVIASLILAAAAGLLAPHLEQQREFA